MTAFLTATWRHLVVATFPASTDALRTLLPPGVELDLWNGQPLASILGLVFHDVRVWGAPVPGHRTFPDVNMRTYVRRRTADGGWTRGVVFVREIVPRRLVAAVARWLFNEKFVALPLRCDVGEAAEGVQIRYEWRLDASEYRLSAAYVGEPRAVPDGSLEHFILERRRGFVTRRDGRLLTYGIERVPWRAWSPTRFDIDVDGAALYGPSFAGLFHARPLSVVVAEGSRVTVRKVDE